MPDAIDFLGECLATAASSGTHTDGKAPAIAGLVSADALALPNPQNGHTSKAGFEAARKRLPPSPPHSGGINPVPNQQDLAQSHAWTLDVKAAQWQSSRAKGVGKDDSLEDEEGQLGQDHGRWQSSSAGSRRDSLDAAFSALTCEAISSIVKGASLKPLTTVSQLQMQVDGVQPAGGIKFATLLELSQCLRLCCELQ